MAISIGESIFSVTLLYGFQSQTSRSQIGIEPECALSSDKDKCVSTIFPFNESEDPTRGDGIQVASVIIDDGA